MRQHTIGLDSPHDLESTFLSSDMYDPITRRPVKQQTTRHDMILENIDDPEVLKVVSSLQSSLTIPSDSGPLETLQAARSLVAATLTPDALKKGGKVQRFDQKVSISLPRHSE